MNEFSSIFGQILQIFSMVEFYRAVKLTDAEKGAKGFTCCPVFNTGHVILSMPCHGQIEIFFKTIKQNLKIKTFVGTSPNALMIQIWTALIAILVLKYLKFRSKFGWSLSNLVAMLRYNLFAYRDLWKWIDNPYEQPPIVPDMKQLLLGFV